MRRTLLSALIATSALLAMPSAHAQNVLERILANPKVQELIGKPSDVLSALGRCGNANYQRSNSQLCESAMNADRALKMPVEMRLLMTNKQSAASLREMCIAAQPTHLANTYLCAELAKADKTFGAQMEFARQKAAQDAGPNASN
jgi:hypothetical protein